ncbi:MAG: TatD family hydrolase [Spirosomataceae bacterium]
MFINIHTHQSSSTDIEIVQWDVPAQLTPEDVPENPGGSSCSVGLHPAAIHSVDWKMQLDWVYRALSQPQVKAIGECGLDRLVTTPLELQEEVFIQQLKWAMETRKPLIIHCVRAYDELIAIQKVWRPKIPMLVHGFHKNSQLAEALFKRGFYLSLDHRIPTSFSPEFLESNIDQILLETDSQQVGIEWVYQEFSQRIGWTLDRVQEKMEENYLLFTQL